MHINHIESIPFYHFQPGSRSFVLGGAGCSLNCDYCSNAYVARSDPKPLMIYELPPKRVIELAEQYGCHNIAFAINEPAVAIPTLLELAAEARPAGLPVGVLTNGYVPAGVAETMARAFDFINVSIKGAASDFYRRHTGVADYQTVLKAIEVMQPLTHLEISTPVVQGMNDGDIPEIADFIAGLDPSIPWHVFRLLPEYRMASIERPPIKQVNDALEEARKKLHFIYFGNFVGSQWVSTFCPHCGELAIERISMGGCGSKLTRNLLVEERCPACDSPLPITGGSVDWYSKDGEICI
jgi:pyruvate-formate lyase-activating enzyme